MDKKTRQNPATWGITEQEMNFADAYVFLYFHNPAVTCDMAVNAARMSGYEVPSGMHEADALGVSLKGKTKKYIDAEIERFREILSAEQRKNLWKHISDYAVQEADESDGCNRTTIIVH